MSRYIFIDNIKVFGNFIRCMIHAAVPYMVTYSAMWPFTEKGLYIFDFAIFEGHLFLMELFFLLTGFLFALQLQKKTITQILSNRFKKIVLPFVIGLVVIMPVVLSFFKLNEVNTYNWFELTNLKTAYLQAWELGLANFFPTGHLWFLYYLLYFYLLSILLYPFFSKIKLFLEQFSFVTLLIGCCVLSIISFFFMKRWLVDNPLTFIPELPSLIHYYLFFFMGLLLFSSEKLSISLESNRKLYFIIGAISGVIAIIPQLFFEKTDYEFYTQIKYLAIFLHVLATFTLTVSIWSYFKLNSTTYNKLIAYLSDANYWIYVTFLPLAMFIQLCLLPLSISIVLKFLITYISATSICLFTYEYFVRYTWIGASLNSKKSRKSH
jgi:glucans biosynthesis protein C